MSATPLRPQLILFDAVGTLIEPVPSVFDVYQSIGAKHGLRLDRVEMGARLVVAMTNANFFLRKMEWDWQTDDASEFEYWQTVVSEVFEELSPDEATSAFRQLWSHFAQPQHWRAFDDVAPTLAGLRRLGYRCGIASNFDSRLFRICAAHPVLAEFDPVFVSSEVGWSKPAAGFFHTVERRIDLFPEQILIVGDDRENDVKAPGELGWQTHWLQRFYPEDPASHLSSLTDLLAILS